MLMGRDQLVFPSCYRGHARALEDSHSRGDAIGIDPIYQHILVPRPGPTPPLCR
jgi:hypothetical protein